MYKLWHWKTLFNLWKSFWGPSAPLRGLLPLFWGSVALISSWITLVISYLDCPAWVHNFRHKKLYDWSIFCHDSLDCVKSVWKCEKKCFNMCDNLKTRILLHRYSPRCLKLQKWTKIDWFMNICHFPKNIYFSFT